MYISYKKEAIVRKNRREKSSTASSTIWYAYWWYGSFWWYYKIDGVQLYNPKKCIGVFLKFCICANETWFEVIINRQCAISKFIFAMNYKVTSHPSFTSLQERWSLFFCSDLPCLLSFGFLKDEQNEDAWRFLCFFNYTIRTQPDSSSASVSTHAGPKFRICTEAHARLRCMKTN